MVLIQQQLTMEKMTFHNFIQSTIVITNKNFRTQDTVSGTAVYGTELTLADKQKSLLKL